MAEKQLLTLCIGRVDGAIHLVQKKVLKKIVDTQPQGGFGIALLAKCLVDQDAQARPLVDGVVVEDVDAANSLSGLVQVNHQTELFLTQQVVVAHQKLFDLETGVGHMGTANPPYGPVILPGIDQFRILGLGATERYHVVFDKHTLQIVDNS